MVVWQVLTDLEIEFEISWHDFLQSGRYYMDYGV